MKRLQSGQTLAATLVVLAIICILAAVYFLPRGGESIRKDGKGTTTVGAVLYEAKDTVCKNQLDQVRQLIVVYTQTNGDMDPAIPENLSQVPGITAALTVCPIGKEPYSYTSVDGKVRCPHPGHENF